MLLSKYRTTSLDHKPPYWGAAASFSESKTGTCQNLHRTIPPCNQGVRDPGRGRVGRHASRPRGKSVGDPLLVEIAGPQKEFLHGAELIQQNPLLARSCHDLAGASGGTSGEHRSSRGVSDQRVDQRRNSLRRHRPAEKIALRLDLALEGQPHQLRLGLDPLSRHRDAEAGA